MTNFERPCRKCKQYIAHDEYFGYCIKFNQQARYNDNCTLIMEMIPDER